MTKEQIEQTLKERPDIMRIFELIMEYPEQQREMVAGIVTAILKSRRKNAL